jgi:hypothetical protein
VAFAVTAIHEGERARLTGSPPDDLCEEVLFWGAKQIDGDASNGTRFSSANVALQRWGQPLEALWPYDDLRDHRAPTYQPPAAAIDPLNCMFSALRPIAVDVAAVRAQLDDGQPIVLGIPVWEGLRRAMTEPLPVPRADELYPTRHAVIAIGYDSGRAAILIRNSWGHRWGIDGHLWINDGLLGLVTGAWTIDDTHGATVFDPQEEILSDESDDDGPA